MVNVDVRQREFYTLGYPYKSDVDVIFEKLTKEQEEIVADINIINDIYDFKNKILEFDKKIVNKIYFVNKHIYEFEKNNSDKLNKYNEKFDKLNKLKKKFENISAEIDKKNDDRNYYVELKDKLNSEIEYLESLISNINTKLNIVSDVNIDTLSVDVENRINILNTALMEMDREKNNYNNNLYSELTDFSILMQNFIDVYSEYCVVLHIHYNEWVKRYESEYYNYLIEYFKSDYESCGTYGEHLVLDNKLNEIKSFNNKLLMMKNQMIDLFVRYDELVSELNTLKYIHHNLNKINSEHDYFEMYKKQKLSNYNQILIDIKSNYETLKSELQMFVTENELEFYNKYVDTANKIIRYVLINKNNVDDNVVAENKRYLVENENQFKEIKKKLNDKDYLNKKIMYEILTKEYARIKYYIELTTLNKDVAISGDENLIKLKEQLSEYLKEKENKEEDIIKIDEIIEDIELDISVLKDELSKLKVNIEDLNKETGYVKQELVDEFEKYLKVVFFDSKDDIYEGFKEVYSNQFKKYLFEDEINELKKIAYDKFALLYNKILIDELFDKHYKYFNQWLNKTLLKYYAKQIKMNFYIDKYLKYLNELMNEKIQELFGKILKFFYKNEFDSDIEKEIGETIEFVKQIFDEICKHKTEYFVVKYVSDIHDYSIVSEISECSDEITDEFNNMLDMYLDYVKFINNKRLEIENQQVQDNIIEKFWDNWS